MGLSLKVSLTLCLLQLCHAPSQFGKAKHRSPEVQGSPSQLSPGISLFTSFNAMVTPACLPVSCGLSAIMCGEDLADLGPVLHPAGKTGNHPEGAFRRAHAQLGFIVLNCALSLCILSSLLLPPPTSSMSVSFCQIVHSSGRAHCVPGLVLTVRESEIDNSQDRLPHSVRGCAWGTCESPAGVHPGSLALLSPP